MVVGQPEKDEAKCSCTDSCQEAVAGDAVEARKEAAADAIASKGHDAGREDAGARGEAAPGAVAMKREAMGTRDDVKPMDAAGKKREAAAEMRRRTVQRRRWRRGAAWCGAAGVVAVVAVGLAVELAAEAHHNVNVYVVPT